MGWVVSVGKDGKDYAEKVTNANEVRFNGTDGIKVTGETKGSVRHINISLEKGAVVKQDEYTIEGKTYVSIDGKLYNKDDVDFSGNKPKAKEGKQPSNYIVKDSTVVNNTTPDNPVPVDAKVDKADHFVDGNTVYTAIQKSGWTVGKADESLTKKAFEKTENVNKDEKVNPNDAVRFADGKGITVKTATVEETNEDGSKQTTTVVKFDTNLPIDYSVTNKNATGDTLKQAKDGNWYKEADVNADGTVKVTDGNKPTPETIVKTESGITLKNDATTSYTPADKTTDKNKGTGGVQLNNVGWAETPDQAVNKDQLDQTVNKSGFTVKLNDGNTTDGNKTDGSLLSTPEKVTPNDVINFKNGKGTTIKAVTKRENGVDTTTVSVDVDSSASPIVYTDGAGKELKKEGDKYYRNDDVKDAVKIGDKFYKNGTTEDDVNKGKAEEIKAVEKVIASIPGNSGNPASLKVGDGNVSSDSKEAVNGKQLHETNVLVDKNTQVINTTNTQVNKNTQAINAINNAINNQSGAFDRLERKINKQGKEARAGIAGANAAAALPQVYTAGKSMVAASAGTFKGQNALAVGYSRASDNGKMILKLQGNANTSGDIGAGVGVGYQW
ncbi:MAG: YadA-like family protein [Haemophilus haemolyticus]|nr:YadA-like family protein [Haemophilus haemolyticus]